ncbi:glycosyl transferase [Leptolyngbya sp. PCC 7375]|nr:glycosyl transferase [Leptolyngbya sp. PCC 7375]
MSKLLTIAIPTYNRASLLDQQMAWLNEAIHRLESSVEILISDNASNDETQRVIEKWCPQFSNVQFTNHRQPSNLGPIRNIEYCIEQAKGKFVWVVSDDDRLRPETLGYIVKHLSEKPDLTLIVLNHAAKNFAQDIVAYEQCYRIKEDVFATDGKSLFSKCLLQHQGGVTLTTALIYRTSVVQDSLTSWPEGMDNFSVQTYMTAYCALYGSVLLTAIPYVVCALGDHWFIQDTSTRNRFRYEDKPAMYARLSDIGYGRVLMWKFCLTVGQSIFELLQHPSKLPLLLRKLFSLANAKFHKKSA